MTQMIVLPHVELCPDGAVIEAEEGKSICENLLANDIELDHACEMSCACTTCHVIVREGFDALHTVWGPVLMLALVFGGFAWNLPSTFRTGTMSVSPPSQ